MAPRSKAAASRSKSGPAIRPTPPRSQGAGATLGTPPVVGAHIKTVGVKRPSYGVSGSLITVLTNHFPITIPDEIISHYDVISPSEKTLPARLNMELITHLQKIVAPEVFTPKAVYDGRKNLFSIKTLKFPNGQDNCEFDVSLMDEHTVDRPSDAKGPKVYKVKLNKVAEINPVVLQRFLEGKQSHDNDVLTAITALNVVIRMEPNQKYPFNVRSFFTSNEKKDIGQGLELWRGYFQSIRPAPGRMLINIDISTGTMYKPGPLMNLCMEYIGKAGNGAPNYEFLSFKRGFPERERLRLQRFIAGVRIKTTYVSNSGYVSKSPRIIKKLSDRGAQDIQFKVKGGEMMRVSEYFAQTTGKKLKYPDLPCVELGNGSMIPLEYCEVIEGQIMRKQVPPELIKDVLEFATRKPEDRLQSIRNGLNVLSYGQSEYVRQFGMHMEPNQGPLRVQARILPPPKLKYVMDGRAQTITPKDGSWNMMGKKFFQPATIHGWIIVIYERKERFTMRFAHEMAASFTESCQKVGITFGDKVPDITYLAPQGNVLTQLTDIGSAFRNKKGFLPNLVVAVLPEGATDIYTAIKHFGDCKVGVATQCMKSSKCSRAKEQYFANICLKVNAKLGGINTIPDATSARILTDVANPTLVLGADVIHPSPGSEGRPSFTALVGNVDSDTSKYIAATRVQTSRREMIDDLEDMAKYIISKYCSYRRVIEKKTSCNPKRIIFYRDGVSEGQFAQVIEYEVPKIKKALEALGMVPMPKITVIVVGKRHHVRFFPISMKDRSGNCPAGTVVDRDVTNPAEFDFYLQSHGGLLGTSRPAHYNVLLDENKFTPDGLQQLSFTLCHVYARSTRSVSIPAPVYYADIVCARAKNHFDPTGNDGFNFDDSISQNDDEQADRVLESFKSRFRPLHSKISTAMYFS